MRVKTGFTRQRRHKKILGLTKITKSSTEEGVSQFIQQENVGYPVAKENGWTLSHGTDGASSK